jgi:hypothetical protein
MGIKDEGFVTSIKEEAEALSIQASALEKEYGELLSKTLGF